MNWKLWVQIYWPFIIVAVILWIGIFEFLDWLGNEFGWN